MRRGRLREYSKYRLKVDSGMVALLINVRAEGETEMVMMLKMQRPWAWSLK